MTNAYRLFLVLLAALLPAGAEASIGSAFGMGPVSMGMGTTAMVHGEPNAYATYNNPAHLGFITRVQASGGVLNVDPQLKPFGMLVINSSGTVGEFQTSGVLPGAGNTLALALPFGKERPLTFGASFFLPYSSFVRVSGSPVNYPFYPMYNDITRNAFFVLGFGVQVFQGISFGMNFLSSIESIAAYELRSDNSISYSANAVEARNKTGFGFAVTADFEKINGRPSTLAAIYRPKSELKTKLAADITAFAPIQGELISYPAFSPAEMILAFSRRFGEQILSLEGSWARWSEYRNPHGTGNINSFVVGSGASVADFKDVPVGRIGFQGTVRERGLGFVQRIVYRLGYSYYPSPVPEQRLDSNFADSTRHIGTLGFGFTFPKPWDDSSPDGLDLDVFGQWNFLEHRRVDKLASNNIGAPGYTTGGNIYVYGVNATLSF